MNYTAKDHFPTWYKATNVASNTDTLNARLEALDDIITNDDAGFWQDIVRISVGLDPSNAATTSTFVKSFLETDKTFPVSNNEQLVKVLAACALCFRLEAPDQEGEETDEEEESEEEQDDKETDHETTTNVDTAISLCICNLNFLGQFKNDNHIPVIDYARQYLESKSYAERIRETEEEFEALDDIKQNLEANKPMSNDSHQGVINAIEELRHEKTMLAEELNVLSWIFGEYSSKAGKFFQDAGASLMLVYAPLELQEKTANIHYLNSAKGFLHRILSISNGAKKVANVAVFDAIDALPAELKISLAKQYKTGLSELTPFLFAISKSTEFDAGQDFATPYKKVTKGGDLKKTFKPEVIATQLYNEIVFIKTLQNV